MTPSGSLGILRVFPGERVGQARPPGQRARVSAPRRAQGFRIDESKPNRWFPKYDPTDGKPPAEPRASAPPCPRAPRRTREAARGALGRRTFVVAARLTATFVVAARLTATFVVHQSIP